MQERGRVGMEAGALAVIKLIQLGRHTNTHVGKMNFSWLARLLHLCRLSSLVLAQGVLAS